MPTGICPECETTVFVSAEVVTCQDCNQELSVISFDPIKLVPKRVSLTRPLMPGVRRPEDQPLVKEIDSEKLYTISQAVFATFAGGPLGGAILLAQNYKQLGVPKYARRTILVGLLATAMLLPIALVLPESVPNAVLPVGYTIGFRLVAEHLQGEALKTRLEAGGSRHSWWRAVAISAITFLGTALVFMAGILLVIDRS